MMSTVTVFKEQNLVENDDLTSTEFKAPRCLDFFDMWRFCASAWNQFHQYYIYGKFQDCSVYSKALGSCISYKATKSSENRDVMLKAMKTKEIKFTSSSVWQKRENPHEYWNGKE